MCTLQKRGNLFILTLTGADEHRLNPTLLNAIQSALRRVRAEATASSALITTAHGKYFCNGFDLAWAQSLEDRMVLMDSMLRSVISDLISLPMPTIAAVTGHASGAGYILALSHDYILMRSDRGFLYMSELNIKLVIAAWFIALVEAKIGSPAARREVVMTAAKEALKLGIIDSAHNSAEQTVQAAMLLGEDLVKRGWAGHVYGENRKQLLGRVLDTIGEISTVSRL
ncbi:hypothetical protein L6164_016470 [Bauhinia variegata]|uniref:Uncharacterized protein n=1 Tax=Bauhinia variegata TaxID=167791 RepID=A0ACB9NQ22_BAUVA|nr:hypothetical protein L6164_016470 [Bauhinia variegata]